MCLASLCLLLNFTPFSILGCLGVISKMAVEIISCCCSVVDSLFRSVITAAFGHVSLSLVVVVGV